MNCLFFSAVDDEEDNAGGEGSEGGSGDVGRILSPFEILDAVGRLTSEPRFTVGFLGYPNVGKSSTINRFLTNKKLQVWKNYPFSQRAHVGCVEFDLIRLFLRILQ